MKNVNKVQVVLSLPDGAHFYKNIHVIVYKKFIQFIHKMNCLAPREKCYTCPLSSTCRYYHYTGENFRYYPAIIISNDLFARSIYQKEELLTFNFFLIGDAVYSFQYIKVFFEDYLRQKLAGAWFYIRDIDIMNIDEELIPIDHLNICTVIENKQFIESYNHMIIYYNQKYNTQFQPIESCSSIITSLKHIHIDDCKMKTKNIRISGYIYKISFSQSIQISSAFKEVGVGYYNMIGGGYFET